MRRGEQGKAKDSFSYSYVRGRFQGLSIRRPRARGVKPAAGRTPAMQRLRRLNVGSSELSVRRFPTSIRTGSWPQLASALSAAPRPLDCGACSAPLSADVKPSERPGMGVLLVNARPLSAESGAEQAPQSKLGEGERPLELQWFGAVKAGGGGRTAPWRPAAK